MSKPIQIVVTNGTLDYVLTDDGTIWRRDPYRSPDGTPLWTTEKGPWAGATSGNRLVAAPVRALEKEKKP